MTRQNLSPLVVHFSLVVFHFYGNISKMFAEDSIPRRKDDSGSATLTMSSLPRDIHGAPQESFVVRLSEIIGRMKTLQKMASFWCSVVSEVSEWVQICIL